MIRIFYAFVATVFFTSCTHATEVSEIDKSSYEPAINEDLNLNYWWDAEYNLIDEGLSKDLFPSDIIANLYNTEDGLFPADDERENVYRASTEDLAGDFKFISMIGWTGVVLDSFWRENTDHPTIRARQYFLTSGGPEEYGVRQKCWFGEHVNEWTVEECPTRSESLKDNGL